MLTKKMGLIATSLLIFLSISFAEEEKKSLNVGKTKTSKLIDLHEHMSKAHREVAECLRSGKALTECRNTFHSMCVESEDVGQCRGMWRFIHKGKNKKVQ